MKLKFRIKSWIFPDWVYSEDHYKISDFFYRWEIQYINSPEYYPEMEQFINGNWEQVFINP